MSYPRPNKFRNHKVVTRAGKFDSKKEAALMPKLELLRRASNDHERVVNIERQVPYLLIPAQRDGMGRLLEKSVVLWADYRVTYADGRVEVIDVKSPITRKLPAYVIKRKLLLKEHNIRLLEV